MQPKNHIVLTESIDNLKASREHILNLTDKTDSEITDLNDEQRELLNINNDINNLSQSLGIEIENNAISGNTITIIERPIVQLSNPIILEQNIDLKFISEIDLKTELSGLDWIVVGFSAAIAVLLDFMLVKTPKNPVGSTYPKNPSALTTWLRDIGVDSKGDTTGIFKWLENHCRVPFDSTSSSDIPGMNPRNHRLFSLGHDPILGLIFGLHDIFRGGGSFITQTGEIVFVHGVPVESNQSIIFAPLIWLGHIVSDIVTRAGIPIPGWGLSQLLKFGSFGEKGRSVSDISRWMYLNGYDLRHMITMSIVPASIEIIIRGYFLLTELCEDDLHSESILFSKRLDDELAGLRRSVKLHKMLFFTHLIASSGNALRVAVNHGNPLTINIAEWISLAKSSHNMYLLTTRNKTPEIIIRNRDLIEQTWAKIICERQSTKDLPPPPIGLYKSIL